MKVLYGVTGGVATALVFKMMEKLRTAGHEVEIIATERSFYFWKKDDPRIADSGIKVWSDANEWPNAIYEKDEPVRHILLRDWAELILIAPLTANTLAKMANGFADNLLTSVMRAWDPEKPVVLAPAMNTLMWRHPVTATHLKTLEGWYGRFSVVKPVAKKLACGDVGIGALAEIPDIVTAVERWNE